METSAKGPSTCSSFAHRWVCSPSPSASSPAFPFGLASRPSCTFLEFKNERQARSGQSVRTRACGESDGCRNTYLWFLSVAGAGEGGRYVSKRFAGIEERTNRRGGATHSLDTPVGTSGDNDRHRPPLVLCEALPHDLLDLTGLLSLGDVVVAVAEGRRGGGGEGRGQDIVSPTGKQAAKKSERT